MTNILFKMEKLIYTYCWGEEGSSGTSYIPFEYESKEKFLFDVFEKFKDFDFNLNKDKGSFAYPNTAKLFPSNDIFIDKCDFDSLEYNICTLDEWFERMKIKTVM
jgi:hypothetical protein